MGSHLTAAKLAQRCTPLNKFGPALDDWYVFCNAFMERIQISNAKRRINTSSIMTVICMAICFDWCCVVRRIVKWVLFFFCRLTIICYFPIICLQICIYLAHINGKALLWGLNHHEQACRREKSIYHVLMESGWQQVI